MRHWVKGPNAGKSEPLADLPGYPDNVRSDGRGGYWVALHREKNESPFGLDNHLLSMVIVDEATFSWPRVNDSGS
ncbi:hypothetical protein EJB05_31071, partial [Eragrostis curvula]